MTRRLCAALAIALTLASCNKSTPTSPSPPTATPAPTPTPPPTPPPPAPTPPPTPAGFILDGRVRESAPTSDQLVRGATIRILDGPNGGATTSSDGNAYYVFNNVAPASFTIQVSQPGYEVTSTPITVSGNRNFDLFLRPTLRILDETFNDTISGGDPACGGILQREPCRRYSFGVHYTDTAEAVLTWGSGANDLDLELWQGSTRVASSASATRTEERVSSRVNAGSSYQWRVVYYSGSTIQSYQLRVRRPN